MITAVKSPLREVNAALTRNEALLDGDNGDRQEEVADLNDDEGYGGKEGDWDDEDGDTKINGGLKDFVEHEEDESFVDGGEGDDGPMDGDEVESPPITIDDEEWRKERKDQIDYELARHRQKRVEDLKERILAGEELSEDDWDAYEEYGGDVDLLGGVSDLDPHSDLDSDILLVPLDDDDDFDESSPISSPQESPEASSPVITENPFDTEAGREITQTLGLERLDQTPDESQKARFLERVTRHLISNHSLLSEAREKLSDLLQDPDIAHSGEGDDALRIIEAASRLASQEDTLEKGDWTIDDDDSVTSQGAQASRNAVNALLIEAGVVSDSWDRPADEAIEALSADQNAEVSLLKFTHVQAARAED